MMVRNYFDGEWRVSSASASDEHDESIEVTNPATGERLASVPVGNARDVDQAVASAARALPEWRRTPANDRVQYLFALKASLEDQFDAIAETITRECGKTLEESKGELRRAIENVEVACGIPMMMQGSVLEDVASGIDEMMIHQPVGVVSVIAPFNFPVMIPFWFLPYAIACGNTVVVKPSEKVPLTMQKVFGLLEATGLPKGVVNLVNGARAVVDAILDHPGIHAVSFVGSTATARHVYSRAAAAGKRVQCQGGAKNPVIVLPDADIDMTTRITADSAFGCAGQRCLAASLAITVGDAREKFEESIAEAASTRVVGSGLDEGTEMGPVISAQSKQRIEAILGQGVDEGAKLLVDGRGASVSGYEKGHFLRPSVVSGVSAESDLAKTEIFGPVLTLVHVDSVDEAIELLNGGAHGNMACLFTRDGAAARKFRYEAEVGNIGINLGVAAPMASFPFSGWKQSFFGDLHAQGRHAVEFYTQTKVVVERWPDAWSRKF